MLVRMITGQIIKTDQPREFPHKWWFRMGGRISPISKKTDFGIIVICPDDSNAYSDSCICWNINLKVANAYIKYNIKIAWIIETLVLSGEP